MWLARVVSHKWRVAHALHQPDRSLDVDLTGKAGPPVACETADSGNIDHSLLDQAVVPPRD